MSPGAPHLTHRDRFAPLARLLFAIAFLLGAGSPRLFAQTSVSPSSLTFNYHIGSSFPPSQNISVTTTPGTAWTAAPTSSGWLAANPTSGSGSGTIGVSVSPSGLVPGTYNGSVQVGASSGIPRFAQTVQVTLNVTGDVLGASPSSILLNNGAGGGSVPGSSTLFNSGNVSTSFTINSTTQSGGNWLTASSSSNTIGAGGSANITITANSALLNPGTYNGTITIRGTSSNTTIAVQFSVNGTTITASPASINLGTLSPPLRQQVTTVTVTSSSGQAAVAVGANTATGNGWLSVDSPQITASASFHVTVNPISLTPGNYSGTITLQCTAAPCIEVDVQVRFTVAGADSLSASPANVPLSNGSGAGTVNTSSLLSNNGNASTSFTITPTTTSGGNWLTATAPTNTIAAGGSVQITVRANTSQLPPGSYSGSVVVNGTSSTATIGVALNVSGTSLTVSPNPINLGNLSAPFNQQVTQVQVTSSSGQAVVAVGSSMQQGSGWLSVDAPQITASTSFHVTVNPTALAPGSYSGTITLQCTAAPCIEVDVPVRFAVGGSDNLRTNPATVQLTGTVASGTVNTTSQLSNAGNASTSFSITPTTSSGGNWLSATAPVSTIAAGGTVPVTITADTTQLTAGTYTGIVYITGINSTTTIGVTLNVTAGAGTSISASPGSIRLTATPNQQQGLMQVITVTSTNGRATVRVGTNMAQGSGWLSVDQSQITTNGSFQVTLNASALPAGNYSGTVTLQCTGTPVCTEVDVPVSFTVSPPIGSGLLYFVPVFPCHVVDTRVGQGTTGSFGPPFVGAGQTRSFNLSAGACQGIPSTARAYSLNVTAIPVAQPGYLGYLSIWPSDQLQPYVSTLNGPKGGAVSNAAIVPAAADGSVNVYVTDASDVLIDVNGYFDSVPSASAYAFYAVTPCRVADTRNSGGIFGGPQFAPNSSRSFPIGQSPCLPGNAGAKSYSFNVTVVPYEPLGSLTLWPSGNAQPPQVATLTAPFADVTANAAIAQAGSNSGGVSFFASNRTDVLFDINGYFGVPANSGALLFHPLTPCRIADTRGGNGPFGGPIVKGGAVARRFDVVSSNCNIPANAGAYSLNVTVVPATNYLGYLSIWPAGQAQPNVSTLNSWDGRVVANAAIVPAGQGGALSVFVTSDSHVILDINGYFTAQQ